MTVAQFWAMTPRETFMVIDAFVERETQAQQREMALAWRIANLSRAKRMPSLKAYLNIKPAKKLTGDELAKRRREHREMTRGVDAQLLATLGRRIEVAKAMRAK